MIMELVQNRSFTLTTGSGKQSRLRRLKNGVPEGSALAPFLYNIYTYYLPSLVSKEYAYFDDSVLLHTSNNWGRDYKPRQYHSFRIPPDWEIKALATQKQ